MRRSSRRRCAVLSILLCAAGLAAAGEPQVPPPAPNGLQEAQVRFEQNQQADRKDFNAKQAEARRAFKDSIQGKAPEEQKALYAQFRARQKAERAAFNREQKKKRRASHKENGLDLKSRQVSQSAAP